MNTGPLVFRGRGNVDAKAMMQEGTFVGEAESQAGSECAMGDEVRLWVLWAGGL